VSPITEVTISAWTKHDGDHVKLDEVIAEIESDKATFELTATASGILKIVVKEGSTVPIGELICTITESDDKGRLKRSPARISTFRKPERIPTPKDILLLRRPYPGG